MTPRRDASPPAPPAPAGGRAAAAHDAHGRPGAGDAPPSGGAGRVVGDRAPYRVVRSSAPVPADLLDVDAMLASPRTRILKESARTTVGVVTIAGADLVLKRFRELGPTRVFDVLALGSGAMRVWSGAARLRHAGFAAPEIVAVLERRRFGICVASCAVSRWVPGEPLDHFWRAVRGAARRTLTVAFADWLRRLHAARLYPQDLRGANVLVTGGDRPEFVLVDLDRVRRHRPLSWARRRKNVVQVHRSVGRGAPATDRLRFLRHYLGTVSRAELRRIVREILDLSRIKDAEYARRRGERPRDVAPGHRTDGRGRGDTAGLGDGGKR